MPNLSRRAFLRGLAGIAVTTAVASSVAPSLFSRLWTGFKAFCTRKPVTLTALDKERIICEALSSEEGRMALAQAMVEPIRRALEYQAIGRKLLMVDELPQGALPRYTSTATIPDPTTGLIHTLNRDIEGHTTEIIEKLAA